MSSGGLVARVQGVKRYYTFELNSNNTLCIGKMFYDYKVLKKVDFNVEFFKEYSLKLEIKNNKIKGYVDQRLILEVEDNDNFIENGGSGLTVSDGTLVSEEVKIN